MTDVLSSIARWMARQVFRLIIIIAILAIPLLFPNEWAVIRDEKWALIRHEIRGLVPDEQLLARLTTVDHRLRLQAAKDADDLKKRIGSILDNPEFEVEARKTQVESDIKAREDGGPNPIDLTTALLTGKGFEKILEHEVEIHFLKLELKALRSIQPGELTIGRARAQYRRKLEGHQRLYADWEEAVAKQRRYEAEHDGATGRARWFLSGEWRRLDKDRVDLLEQNKKAKTATDKARRELDQAEKRAAVLSSVSADVGTVLKPLTDMIAARRRTQALVDAVHQVFPWAAGILVLMVLTPIGIKVVLYFIVAPCASRRAPIVLIRDEAGGSGDPPGSDGEASDRKSVSAVSQEISLDADHELLVHPEYLQTSPDRGRKDTKWLLQWRYPVSSLASGMVALTRIRTNSPQDCVISSTGDAFSEVGLIEVPEGEALAFQPHNLIGVVQRRDQPVRITSHWRLGYLSAWLTLQFRYLVFHGPVTLVVQGCRGVRVEQAGCGRSIDQAATIGFSANVAYSTLRSETFGAYLLGKRGLFNDSFAGGPGVYVYEEMPYGARRSGITGRWLEGFSDAILKAFGV